MVCECITNPYRIPCSLCERAWCFRFGPHAAYQSLPASTCKGHWFLVWSGRPLPRLTIRYHASVLSLRRSATFTIHHLLRPDTQTDTHIEHTRIEHSKTWTHLIKVSTVGRVTQHSTVGTARTIRSGKHGGTCPHTVGMQKEKKKKPDHGRTAFYEHGGRTGMAMLKYPRIQKNAQRYITHPMPASRPCQCSDKY